MFQMSQQIGGIHTIEVAPMTPPGSQMWSSVISLDADHLFFHMV
jgi:hypothetical protein